MQIGKRRLVAVSWVATLASCMQPTPLETVRKLPEGLPPYVFRPNYNHAYIELGQSLFYEKALSGDGRHSCASCHFPNRAFSGRNFKKPGCITQVRDVPPLINLYVRSSVMWDGRASLSQQPELPLSNPCEMAVNWTSALRDINQRPYAKSFLYKKKQKDLQKSNIVEALVIFISSIVTSTSPFDRYYYGADDRAIPKKAVKGLALFTGKAGCSSCHTLSGSFATFSDDGFHAVNLAGDDHDKGRSTASGDRRDDFTFRTPTLRGMQSTGPFFHNGSARTLKRVVHLYNLGQTRVGLPSDRKLKPLGLTAAEEGELVSFLATLGSKPVIYLPDSRAR